MWSKGCQLQIGHFRQLRTGEPQRSHVFMRGVGSVLQRGLASRTLALSSDLPLLSPSFFMASTTKTALECNSSAILQAQQHK